MDKEKNRILSSQSTLSLISEVRNKNKDKINYIGSLSFEDRDLVGIKCILNTEWISSILKQKKIYFNEGFEKLINRNVYILLIS
mgnify:CR=1|jgi:hypothetical protein